MLSDLAWFEGKKLLAAFSLLPGGCLVLVSRQSGAHFLG